MSYAAVFSTSTPNNPSKWGNWGPDLNDYHLDRMRWIPRDRIFRFGADNIYDKVLHLAPLSSS